MKNSLHIVLLFLFLGTTAIQAQQLPLFNQFRESSGYINPATISFDYFNTGLAYSAGATYRGQWLGNVEGAPVTMMARVEQYADEKNILWGVNILNDVTGPTSYSAAYFRFGYVAELNEMLLSVALTGGLVQYRVKGHELFFLEPDDIAHVNYTKISPDVGLGVQLYYPDKFYFGFSIPQTLGLDLTYRNEVRDFNITRVQHFFANAGFFIPLYQEGSFFEISAWGKYVQNAPFNADMNFKYQHQNGLWLGFGGSTSKALRAEFGFNLFGGQYETDNLLKIGYAYDYHFSQVGPYFGASHEFNISYAWGWGYY